MIIHQIIRIAKRHYPPTFVQGTVALHHQSAVHHTEQALRTWALAKLGTLDIEAAKRDVERFVPDQRVLDGWSRELFHAAIERITA